MADALVRYAAALAQTNGHDVVEVPTRRLDGSSGHTTLFLSPTSQIAAESLPHVGSAPDPVDEELIDHLEKRTRMLLTPRSPQPEAVPAETVHLDF
ncbi:hypothetical protein [Naasia sp. SYSU D00948]|uniref:hypothetical protein n=1 Tax=Naasia sp. SYSU D00948 TaxID=2817379 RepID=UPI001B310EFC|nr:hypothetical protein [Naasia sp. SYSU D00948]